MKKCPYCAEKIQDEAIVCRYCLHDIPKPAENPSPQGPVVQGEIAETDRPKKRLRDVFWPALGFGIGMGSLLFSFRLSKPNASLNDALLGGISNVFIYGFLFSLIVFIWRKWIKRIPGLDINSSESGCLSMLIFFLGLSYFIFYFLSQNFTK